MAACLYACTAAWLYAYMPVCRMPVWLHGRYAPYHAASAKIMAVVQRFFATTEVASIDEAYAALQGTPPFDPRHCAV